MQVHNRELDFICRMKSHLYPDSFRNIKINEINKPLLYDLAKIAKQKHSQSQNMNSSFRLSYLLKILSKLINQYEQMRNTIRPVERQFPNKIHLLTNSYQDLIEQLSNTKCIGCSEFLIQNFAISSSQMLCDTKPYIIANENNFFIVEEVQSYICSLANRNGGSILIVTRHIKNIIKQGIKNINKSYQERLKIIISQAYNAIIGKQNIGITVEAIPLKKDNVVKQNQYVIRINVNVSKNRQKEGFYTEYKFKNFKPVYKVYDLSVWSSNDFIQMKPVQIQNDYKKIQLMRGRQPQLILCKCCQRFEAGIKIKMNLITGVPMLKEQPNFNSNSKQFAIKLFNRVQKGFKEKQYLQHLEFPEISPQQSAVIFVINEICQKKKLLQLIDSIFRDTKTTYKMIHPLKSFQEIVNTSEKIAKPLVKACDIVYFIFEGKFDHFKNLFEEVVKKQGIRREQFLYEQLQNRIQLTYMVDQKQIDKFNDLIYQIFVTVPTWDNMEYPQGKNQNKLYKNASVTFYDLNIAVFGYLLFYFAKLRPKFEKKQKKKQLNFQPKYMSKTNTEKKNDMFNINSY